MSSASARAGEQLGGAAALAAQRGQCERPGLAHGACAEPTRGRRSPVPGGGCGSPALTGDHRDSPGTTGAHQGPPGLTAALRRAARPACAERGQAHGAFRHPLSEHQRGEHGSQGRPLSVWYH